MVTPTRAARAFSQFIALVVRTVAGINRKAAVWTGKKEVSPLADNSQQLKRPAFALLHGNRFFGPSAVCGPDVLDDAE